MNGIEHYQEAERLIQAAKAEHGLLNASEVAVLVAEAQVHATLAQAAAAALTATHLRLHQAEPPQDHRGQGHPEGDCRAAGDAPMSVHWHDDDEIRWEWCPCDEREGSGGSDSAEVPTIRNDPDNNADAQQAGGVTVKVDMIVDYNKRSDSWFGRCAEHGEIVHAGGKADDHNRVVIELAKHDEREHGGDGTVHWTAWVR